MYFRFADSRTGQAHARRIYVLGKITRDGTRAKSDVYDCFVAELVLCVALPTCIITY